MNKKFQHVTIVVSFFVLLYCLFFSPVLFSGRILAIEDSLALYLPSFLSPVSLWEPALQGGFPVAADLQNASWYPISRFFSLFSFWNGFVISGYVLMSCFSYAYAYFLTKSWVGAAVSGIVYGMCGFAMAHLGHTIIIHGMAWIPLVLLAIEKLKTETAAVWFAIGSCAIALSLLSGHPQIPAYGLIVAAFYALTIGVFGSNPRIRFFALTAGMFIVGAALTAIQTIPLFELVSQSIREKPDLTFYLTFSFKPMNLITLVFPALFGTPDSSLYYAYFGGRNFTEKTAYTGLITILLSVIGLQRHQKKRLLWFWGAVFIIGLLLSLGLALPFARFLFFIPGLRNFRAPARHLFEMTLAVSFLAGFGGAALHQRAATLKSILWSVISGAIILIIAGTALWFSSLEIENIAYRKGVEGFSLSPLTNPAVVLPIFLFFIASVVLFCYLRKPSTFRASCLLGTLILDLATLGFFGGWRLAPEKSVLYLPQTLNDLPHELQETHQRFMPVRGVWSDIDEGKPNLTRLWAITSGSGYGSLILKRMFELFEMPTEGNLRGNWMASQNRSLDIMAIRYLSAKNKPAESDPTENNKLPASRRWKVVRQFGNSVILENRRAMPRAWLVSKVMHASSNETRNAIVNSILPARIKFRPEDVALVEDDFSFEGKEDPGRIVRIKKIEKTSMEIHVETAHPAFLVISDVHYPGWTAKVNNTFTHMYRTNYLFRGLLVPAGFTTILMEYRPASFRCGLAITVGSFLMIVIVAASAMIRKKNAWPRS